jgi:endonuclease G, mitochondrial
MATPSTRPDAPRGETIDEGNVGRRRAAASATDAPPTVARASVPTRDAAPGGVAPIVVGAGGATTVTIQITITTAGGASTDAASGGPSSRDEPTAERDVEPWHDEEYGSRRGYSPTFLGRRVALPRLVRPSTAAKQANGSTQLPYQHFSIVMHKTRRLAIYTAANVDGTPRAARPDPTKQYSRAALSGLSRSDRERWFTDPRLPAAHQLTDAFFSNDGGAFDRGHVVMRDTVAWGTSYAMVRRANGDSYHTTNCTPQVAGFNQATQRGRWGRLEQAIARAGTDARVSVFAGPVLSPDDWWFDGEDADGARLRLQIPSRFWKVVVGVGDDGALVAYGFLLTQDLDAVPLKEEFALDTSAWRDEFVSIAALEAAAALVRFPAAVHDADQFATERGEALRATLEYGAVR